MKILTKLLLFILMKFYFLFEPREMSLEISRSTWKKELNTIPSLLLVYLSKLRYHREDLLLVEFEMVDWNCSIKILYIEQFHYKSFEAYAKQITVYIVIKQQKKRFVIILGNHHPFCSYSSFDCLFRLLTYWFYKRKRLFENRTKHKISKCYLNSNSVIVRH